MTKEEMLFSILTVMVLLLLVGGLAFITLRIKKVMLGLAELIQLLKKTGKL